MRDDLRDAIDSARDCGLDSKYRRHFSFQTVARIFRRVIQELPPDLTVADLIAGLEEE